MSGAVILTIASLSWALGLWHGRRTVPRTLYRRPEYWWCYGVFTCGGFVTFAAFALPDANASLMLGIRIDPMIALGLLMLGSRIKTPRVITVGGFSLLSGCALMFVAGLGHGNDQMVLLSTLMLAPAIIGPEGGYSFEAIRYGVRDSILALLAALLILSLLLQRTAIGACRSDKCSVFGEALGPLGQGNALGIVLAAAAIVSLIFVEGKTEALLVAAGSGMLVDLTSGRSASNAYWIGVGVAIAYWHCRKGTRRWPLLLALAGTTSAVVYLALAPWDPSDFTGRAALWKRGIFLFERSPLFGYGSSYWVNQTPSDALDPNYATHNLLTELMVSGGAAAVVLFAATAVAALLVAREWAFTASTLCALLATSLTEVSSAPGRVYLMPGLLVFALVSASVDRVSLSDREQFPVKSPAKAIATPGRARGLLRS